VQSRGIEGIISWVKHVWNAVSAAEALSNIFIYVENVCMVLSKLITNFIPIHQSSITRGNGMKLYKEQCNIDARHQFFSNRIVDIGPWNSLPASVVLSSRVAV